MAMEKIMYSDMKIVLKEIKIVAEKRKKSCYTIVFCWEV